VAQVQPGQPLRSGRHAAGAGLAHLPGGRQGRLARAGYCRSRKHWYWWPHLEPVLASRGLDLLPGSARPARGPVPNWQAEKPGDPDFAALLQENLMDFARFGETYDLDRAAILRAHRCLDYPEPVIDRPGNYWYWWPDLDRFLMRHPEIMGRLDSSNRLTSVGGRVDEDLGFPAQLDLSAGQSGRAAAGRRAAHRAGCSKPRHTGRGHG
jgi:hypothetical protein